MQKHWFKVKIDGPVLLLTTVRLQFGVFMIYLYVVLFYK